MDRREVRPLLLTATPGGVRLIGGLTSCLAVGTASWARHSSLRFALAESALFGAASWFGVKARLLKGLVRGQLDRDPSWTACVWTVIGSFAAFGVASGTPAILVLDHASLGLAICYGFAKHGCILRGCCRGRADTIPRWAQHRRLPRAERNATLVVAGLLGCLSVLGEPGIVAFGFLVFHGASRLAAYRVRTAAAPVVGMLGAGGLVAIGASLGVALVSASWSEVRVSASVDQRREMRSPDVEDLKGVGGMSERLALPSGPRTGSGPIAQRGAMRGGRSA